MSQNAILAVWNIFSFYFFKNHFFTTESKRAFEMSTISTLRMDVSQPSVKPGTPFSYLIFLIFRSG